MDDGLFAVEHVPFGDTYHATFGSLPRVIEREGQTNPHFYVALYDSEIRDVDAEVGRLLDELRGRKLLDSSLVAIFSDHGESLGDQGYYFGHGKFPYDSTARVPLLLRVPGRSPARIDLPATLLDLPATLLAAAGLPALEETDGIDLLAAVDAGLTDRTIITESGFRKPQIQVRRRDAKLIYVQDEKDLEVLRGNPYEFYRTDADPGEVNDLAGRGDPAEAELRRELEAWLGRSRQRSPAHQFGSSAARPPGRSAASIFSWRRSCALCAREGSTPASCSPTSGQPEMPSSHALRTSHSSSFPCDRPKPWSGAASCSAAT